MTACGWTITSCGCGGCLDGLKPADRAFAVAAATHVMWAATGRRYGLCELTVLPANPSGCADPLYQAYPVGSGGYDPFALGGGSGLGTPVLAGGEWSNRSCGGCGSSNRPGCDVFLDGPVYSIVEVQTDGVVVDPATYQVHDKTLLVRLAGCWPTCQTAAQAAPGFQVTYLRGDPIPTPVLNAAGYLACEYAKMCSGGDCRLPARMQSLSRQGVDVAVLDLPTEGGRIRTGLPLVDAILEADNPYGLTERPRVLSPDLR